MDWSSSGRQDSFRFVRVSWETREEIGLVTGITGGTLERNDLTAIKMAGNLDYYDEPDIGRDLLRVYSDSYHADELVSIAHGTYLVSTPSSTYRGEIEEGTADLYGVLQILAEDAIEEVLSFEPGTVAVSAASQLITGAQLPVVASASAASLNQAATFDVGTPKLDIVNWLMDFAGFASARTDGYGRVQLRPYVDPTYRQPTIAMADDARCIYRAGVVREFDLFSVPNVVTVTCSNSEAGDMTATAVNDDPLSRFSTVSRGRRIPAIETVSDIDSQEALQAKANALLVSKTSAVESYEIDHAFTPFDMGEVLDFAYGKAGLKLNDLAAVRQTMQLRPGMECKTRFRRFVRS